MNSNDAYLKTTKLLDESLGWLFEKINRRCAKGFFQTLVDSESLNATQLYHLRYTLGYEVKLICDRKLFSISWNKNLS